MRRDYRVEQLSVVRGDVLDVCLLYTSDAADERSSVDLGGRRIIKKKKNKGLGRIRQTEANEQHRK